MTTINREYVQYVMHVQTVQEQQPRGRRTCRTPPPTIRRRPGRARARSPALVAPTGGADGEAPPEAEPEAQKPVVKTEWEKTPRNAPCPCGSGKKYKLCHGA